MLLKKRLKQFFAIAFVLSYVFVVSAACHTSPEPTEIEEHILPSAYEVESDDIVFTLEDYHNFSTDIVIAVFEHELALEGGLKDYQFRPDKVYKGQIEGNHDLIHVSSSMGGYVEGESYLLFLEEYRSIYSDYDVEYIALGSDVIAQDSKVWNEHILVLNDAAYAKRKDAKHSDVRAFSDMNDPLEARIERADHILYLEIQDVFVSSDIAPTTVYEAHVLGVGKGDQPGGSEILVTLFNDMVEIGGEYLIFLEKPEPSSLIYTLTDEAGVFSIDDVKADPQFTEMLDRALGS